MRCGSEFGGLPLPVGERGGVRGARSLDRFEPPHPNPLPIRTGFTRVGINVVEVETSDFAASGTHRVAARSRLSHTGPRNTKNAPAAISAKPIA